MHLSDFNYDLPDDLIARYPLPERSASRLLWLNKQTGVISHKKFTDFVDLLLPNDLLVFNDTRVIPARLFGHKETGGRVELLIERITGPQSVLAHMRASKKPLPSSILFFAKDISFKVISRQNDLFELSLQGNHIVSEVLNAIGEIPIPPYFERSPDANDKERYQTIYAKEDGSVAAPTAGLHFDANILAQLQNKKIEMGYVTLHVGAGTFAPVRVEDITQHRMHAEYIEVSSELCDKVQQTKSKGGRVIAVGTTTARSLETASLNGVIQPFKGETDIFIYPGYCFKSVDALLTNFHLPGSTLLMLVAAMAGHPNIMNAYRIAVEGKYRFFSYGDAMLVL